MRESEKTLEKLGSYICDEMCCHLDTGVDKGDYEMQEICERCELAGYLDDIRKCLSYGSDSEITRFSRNSDWIPVEERLPEDDNMVLVTCQTKKGTRNVNRAYCDGTFWHGSGSMSGVIAWMPLPEPYQPGMKVPEEKQEWKERMLRNFLQKGER